MLAIGAEDLYVPVQVYKFVDGGWEKHGNGITDFNSLYRRKLGVCRGYYNGYNIALSGSGDRLVMGSLSLWSFGGLEEWDGAALDVTSYRWNATAGWEIIATLPQVEEPFFLNDTPRAYWPLKCIALSDDASVLAVGSKLSVDVYFWNETSSAWTPRSIDLNAETESKSLVG